MKMLDPLRLPWSASHAELAPASHSFVGILVGAGRGSRTPKGRSPADFESAASASSAIPAKEGELRLPFFFDSDFSIA
jgi:hypothetical protein